MPVTRHPPHRSVRALLTHTALIGMFGEKPFQRVGMQNFRFSGFCCGVNRNVDLGARLPLLATYLGHVGLASSQRYLQLTRNLMGEITRRHQARFGYLINEGGPR